MSVTGWGGRFTLWVELDMSEVVQELPEGAGGTSPFAWDSAVWDDSQAKWQKLVVYTDITPYVLDARISTGFSDELFTYTAGRMTIVLDNSDLRFTPNNPNSPYAIGGLSTIAPRRPIRLRVRYVDDDGVTWSKTLFTGRIETWDEVITGQETAQVALTAVDFWDDFANWQGTARTPVGAGDTFGRRMSRILSAMGWNNGQSIQTGKSTLQATTLEGDASALIAEAVEAEGGAAWVDGNGSFVARGRDDLLSIGDIIAFSDWDQFNTEHGAFYELDSLERQFDGADVVNDVSLTRTGGTEQRLVDLRSQSLYGNRKKASSGLINNTDLDVQQLAAQQLATLKSPMRTIRSLMFKPLVQPKASDGYGMIDYQNAALRLIAQQDLSLRHWAIVQTTPTTTFFDDFSVYIKSLDYHFTPTDIDVTVGFSDGTVQTAMVWSRWDSAVFNSQPFAW